MARIDSHSPHCKYCSSIADPCHFGGTDHPFPSEEAVEFGELDIFLRLKEEWREDEDVSILPQQHIAVPGVHTPMQMTPERQRTHIIASNASADAAASRVNKPIPVNKLTDEIDLGEELSGFGLQGVKVCDRP